MSAVSAAADTGPGAVDIASSVGTWIAAFIAVVALVGVIGPFLAFQASLSDNNRAMNAVQDLPQKYVTRGYRLTRGLRVLRRIRVPNLSPGYIANEPDTAPLMPLRAALGRWAVRSRDYLPWNTGWAKLSELIEAYEPRDGATNEPVALGVATGGTLEVVNSRTALVVNKHWILLLGLLGRYGTRSDKGVLQNTGIRRNFEGERASIRHFRLRERRDRSYTRDGAEHESEWVRKGRRRSWSSSARSSSPVSSSTEESTDETPYNSDSVSLQRSAYGAWSLEKKRMNKIHGVTGTMQALGRHKGSWSYLTSISFVPHAAREMFAPGTHERADAASMETLFWLAHGFLPCSRTPEGQQTVISLESPASEANMPLELLRGISDFGDWPAFSLQEADGIPTSIGNAMQCLSIPEPKVLQFLPLEDRVRRGAIDQEEILRYDGTFGEGDRAWGAIEVEYASEKFHISGTWVHCAKYEGNLTWVFPRKDIERPLGLLLSLDWDAWGFLAWKDRFWASMLKPATGILNQRYLRTRPFIEALELPGQVKAFRWRVHPMFHPHKTADYLELDELISSKFQGSEILPLRLALGALYILDPAFRSRISKACEVLAEYKDKSREMTAAEETRVQIKILEETLDKITKHHMMELQNRPAETEVSENERHTKIPSDYLEAPTLRAFGLSYEYKDGDTSHTYIRRVVPEWEMKLAWEHTVKYRELEEVMKNGAKKRPGALEYNYASKRLKWYFNKEKTDFRTWHLNGDLVRAPLGEKTVTISEKDIALVALWTANRAATWLSSQNSRPLLKFVDELDPYVYVL